ncbi:MAG: hypothetical protein MJ209_05890 [archaeon]|nr:hypothetical protein [archaeon]
MHTAPEDCCNLFKQDPIVYESLFGGGYSMNGGDYGRVYRRRQKLCYYINWRNKQIY